jgi:hypothetical protein
MKILFSVLFQYVVACGSRSGDQAVFSKIIGGNDAAKYPWNAAIWIDEG